MNLDSLESLSRWLAFMVGSLSFHFAIKEAQLGAEDEVIQAKLFISTTSNNHLTLLSVIGMQSKAFTLGVEAIQVFRYTTATSAAGERIEDEVRRIMTTAEGEITAEMLDEFRNTVPSAAFYRYLLYLVSLRLRPEADVARAGISHKSYPKALKPLYDELGDRLGPLLNEVRRPVRLELQEVEKALAKFPFDNLSGIYIGQELSRPTATFTVQLVEDGGVTVWQIAVNKVIPQ